MKVCRKCGEEKPLTEFYKHKRTPDRLRYECKSCSKALNRAWYKANPEKAAAKDRRKRANNPEHYRAKDRARWYAGKAETRRQWAKRTADKRREVARRWRERNITRVRYHTALYQATKAQRTPKWLTAEQRAEIQAKYDLASALSSDGVTYHVDHIYPLRGKLAWGLHVPWNLQVITAEENIRKRNKLPEELTICRD